MLHIAQRQELYRNLATLFSYPDAGLVKLLGRAEAWAAAARLNLPKPSACTQVALMELEEAYTALFDAGLGGAVAPPYGSVYLDEAGQLMGPSTLKVEACFAEAGLRLEGTVEPADFLPTELEFLYYLVDREVRCLAERNMAAAQEQTGRQREFLETWLLPWLPKFVARIEARPLHPVYLWGAQLLLAFVRGELEWLKKLPK